MVEEILKFKTYDKEKKEWDDGTEPMTFMPHNEGEGVFAFYMSEPNPRYVFVQYIGLKDKNGREVYAGDKVKHSNFIGVICFGFWETFDYDTGRESGYGYYIGNIKNGEIFENICEDKDLSMYAVVGNICEDSEEEVSK